jgi:hypothetical protein
MGHPGGHPPACLLPARFLLGDPGREDGMSGQALPLKPDTPVCLRPDLCAKITRCGKDTRAVRWSEDRKRVTCPDCKAAKR